MRKDTKRLMHETVTIPKESYMGRFYNRYLAKVTVGKYTSIGNDLTIITSLAPSVLYNTVSNHPFYERFALKDYPESKKGGKITIGNDVWIARNVSLIGELSIGDGAIVGAFSVVAKDVPPYSIVVGNPIRIIRYRFNEDQIRRLLEIKWWDWPQEKIFANIKDFTDINVFIAKYHNNPYV